MLRVAECDDDRLLDLRPAITNIRSRTTSGGSGCGGVGLGTCRLSSPMGSPPSRLPPPAEMPARRIPMRPRRDAAPSGAVSAVGHGSTSCDHRRSVKIHPQVGTELWRGTARGCAFVPAPAHRAHAAPPVPAWRRRRRCRCRCRCRRRWRTTLQQQPLCWRLTGSASRDRCSAANGHTLSRLTGHAGAGCTAAVFFLLIDQARHVQQ